MSAHMTEDQIHEHEDFKKVLDIVTKIESQFAAQTGSPDGVMALLDATMNNEILAHFAGHRVMEVGSRYMPEQILSLVSMGMLRVYIEAFMVGAHYQAHKDAELITGEGSINIPDFMPDAPDASN